VVAELVRLAEGTAALDATAGQAGGAQNVVIATDVLRSGVVLNHGQPAHLILEDQRGVEQPALLQT
jgi:hypothetical protein